MTASSIRFLGLLFGTLLVLFGVHIGLLYVLESPLFENRIIASYLVNYVLAGVLLYLIQSNFNKKSSNTAFIFMLVATNLTETWTFYLFLTAIEIIISTAIVWYAWTWPKTDEKY